MRRLALIAGIPLAPPAAADDLIHAGGAKARPAYWAPFVVVGDGG